MTYIDLTPKTLEVINSFYGEILDSYEEIVISEYEEIKSLTFLLVRYDIPLAFSAIVMRLNNMGGTLLTKNKIKVPSVSVVSKILLAI